jgi:hypothetical protein
VNLESLLATTVAPIVEMTLAIANPPTKAPFPLDIDVAGS